MKRIMVATGLLSALLTAFPVWAAEESSNFSMVCTTQAQAEDIVNTARTKGPLAARKTFMMYDQKLHVCRYNDGLPTDDLLEGAVVLQTNTGIEMGPGYLYGLKMVRLTHPEKSLFSFVLMFTYEGEKKQETKI